MKCTCRCHYLDATCIQINGGVMTVTVEPQQTYLNYGHYVLVLCAIPQHTGIETVAIFDGFSTYPLIDTNGQPIVSGEMRSNTTYKVRYGSGGTLSTGTMPPHFTCYRDCLYCVEYSSQPTLPTQP